MTRVTRDGAGLRRLLEERARALGFDALAVTGPEAVPDLPARLSAWLDAGHQAGMGWMGERVAERASPAALWPAVRSIVMLGVNAGPQEDPRAVLAARDRGAIAVYAQRRDYHDVIKGKLKELGGILAARGGADLKVFVDTAPVMEKPLAAAAGLGWQGKNTLLVSREFGTWLLLGAIYTNAELPRDSGIGDRCGSCRRCLDVCPTDAFPAPYRLDANRCIAYLTIEHAGPIAPEFREAMGNRVFGCDDCLAVCPWNKFAQAAREARLSARQDLASPALAELARLDEAAFRARFAGTPVKRTGRARVLRNVLIAIGNSGDATLAAEAERLLDDPSPLVRGMAVWALARLAPERLPPGPPPGEEDPDVLREWRLALNQGVQRASPLAGAGQRPA
ncbi:tRNA epoxyqueuosine(34) reductase QueG [Methylobacterium nodulans]|uniref:tRNA epoxyqueuosine(34) reductase QueG n=1 Tax=Methylobacterium nodulans TaxID=114616 RepID=UPI000A2ED814|nr:tRNA epoxyqueuosine(34) reductase QueG [Methylobacterium nodulans]